jgi:hypothetical protein
MANARDSRLRPIANYSLVAIAVALVFTVLAGWFASSRPVSAIDKDKLEKITQDLHSYAAESSLLAIQYKNHRTLNNYTETSAAKLHNTVSSLSDQVKEQTIDPSVKDQANEVLEYANDLEDALSNLIQLPGDKQAVKILDQINNIKQETESS